LRAGHLFSKLEEMPRSDCLGEFELMVLLAVIRLAGDAYGVTIWREIEQRSGREVSLGGVYAALDRMEERGLVTSRLGDPSAARGGRAKRFFRATSDGIGAARDTRKALVSLWSGLPQLGPQGGRA
jgi:DNA-binding PadR family transcriptional regulator